MHSYLKASGKNNTVQVVTFESSAMRIALCGHNANILTTLVSKLSLSTSCNIKLKTHHNGLKNVFVSLQW